ncbi:hypothetical protein H1S01_14840 [Heliobacterium chlorum]|uniref:Uncharacterized protein n=1 Tax=Heliobacterium chlorum TaxID=2698 RepID=A0ABR7T5W8_HELCL|nr:hypothetical protein [Heliobacterium chlorum]MBC9785760.1 hypothetical protein [Heliobacterium chlorum]
MLQAIKPFRVIAFAIIGLAMLWGGQEAYARLAVEQPLHQAISAVIPESAVFTHKESGQTVVEVGPVQVSDLGDTYRQVLKSAQERLGEDVQVRLLDDPDEQCRQLWEQLQFPIYQGLATGNYGEMKKQTDEIVQKSDEGTVKLSIDTDNIYVQIEKGNHYMYRIISGEKRGEQR